MRCRAMLSRRPAAGAGSSRGPEQPGRRTPRSRAGTGSTGSVRAGADFVPRLRLGTHELADELAVRPRRQPVIAGRGPRPMGSATRRPAPVHLAAVRQRPRPRPAPASRLRVVRLPAIAWLLVRQGTRGSGSFDCETYCYATGSARDDLTERIAAASDTWRPVRAESPRGPAAAWPGSCADPAARAD